MRANGRGGICGVAWRGVKRQEKESESMRHEALRNSEERGTKGEKRKINKKPFLKTPVSLARVDRTSESVEGNSTTTRKRRRRRKRGKRKKKKKKKREKVRAIFRL